MTNHFPSDTYLVHHHYCEKVAYRGKKQSVKVMLHVVADGLAEDIQNNLSDHEEENAECNITKRPSILESVCDEDDLHHDIDK